MSPLRTPKQFSKLQSCSKQAVGIQATIIDWFSILPKQGFSFEFGLLIARIKELFTTLSGEA